VGLFKPSTTKNTAEFYDDLMSEKQSRLFWGEKRFDVIKVQESKSIKQFFTDPVSRLLKPEDVVLDLGCGAGMFIPIVAPLCARLVGIEVSPVFVDRSRDVVKHLGLKNTSIIMASSDKMPIGKDKFDVIIVVDVLHHLRQLDKTLSEIKRVLKPGGLVIVYEPNKLNLLLYIMCFLDRNEWGLLNLGRKGIYKRLLDKHFEIESMDYNGLLIGPDGKINITIASILNKPRIHQFLGWLNPKIFMTLRNR